MSSDLSFIIIKLFCIHLVPLQLQVGNIFDQMFKIFSKARSFGNSILLSPLVWKNLEEKKNSILLFVCSLQKSEIGRRGREQLQRFLRLASDNCQTFLDFLIDFCRSLKQCYRMLDLRSNYTLTPLHTLKFETGNDARLCWHLLANIKQFC